MIIREGNTGSLVQAVQLALTRDGSLNDVKDGIFGGRTKAAVMNFQRKYGLIPDGIVGKLTFEKLRNFLTGYVNYTVRAGDTLYKIAHIFNTTVALIENANQDIEANNLEIGRKIAVPLNFSLVPTDINYSSLLVELICEGLAVRYPFISLFSAGKSEMGKYLPVLKIGKGEKKAFFNASHHANEWITTPVVLKYVEDYAKCVVKAITISKHNCEYLYDKTSLYVMPAVNPDGIDLVTGALEENSEFFIKAEKIANSYPNIPFPSGWKANILGTDLNLNYPALWEKAKEIKYEAGFTKPAPRDYVGAKPLSAKESAAVYILSKRENFDLSISYHTQGKEIYWQFENYATKQARELGERLASLSGYTLTSPVVSSSYAGYKDWFLMEYSLPAYTVEAGSGVNPLPITQFNEIYAQNQPLMSEALEYLASL